MSTSKTWPGGSVSSAPAAYSIPAAGELNWATLSDFLNALGDSAQSTTFQKFAVRKATTTPITVSASTDCVVASNLASPGAVTVNLPAGANKQVFIIIDDKGDAATNNITINRNGSDTIIGATSLVLSTNREAVVLIFDSSNSDWKIAARSNGQTPFSNPMTSAGDTIYGAASGVPTRLAAGTTGQVYQANGAGAPSWNSNVTVLGNLTVDTSTLIVDATNNRVGVNTTTPGSVVAADVEIGDGSTATSRKLALRRSGTTATIDFYNDNTTHARASISNPNETSLDFNFDNATNTRRLLRCDYTTTPRVTVGDTSVASGVAFIVSGNTTGGFTRTILFETTPGTTFGEIRSNGNGDLILFANGTTSISMLSGGPVQFNNISTTASAANAFLDNTNSNNLLRSTSSLRYKDDVQTLLESDVMNLRPVSYKSKAEADDKTRRWYGLIAEEVDLIDKSLVNYDEQGRPDGVQYDRICVLLLAEMKKLQARVTELEARS